MRVERYWGAASAEETKAELEARWTHSKHAVRMALSPSRNRVLRSIDMGQTLRMAYRPANAPTSVRFPFCSVFALPVLNRGDIICITIAVAVRIGNRGIFAGVVVEPQLRSDGCPEPNEAAGGHRRPFSL